MRLIVGLGNPGLQYKWSRHNAGFDVLDEMAKVWNIEIERKRFNGLIGEGSILGNRVLLVKPQTFMNESGRSVSEAADFYRLQSSDIIVVCDDIDLPFGRTRVRASGGAGTHNGLRSLVDHLHDGGFARVRLGIGAPPEYMDLADYVLGRVPQEQRKEYRNAVVRAAHAVETIVAEGIEKAQARFNGPPDEEEQV